MQRLQPSSSIATLSTIEHENRTFIHQVLMYWFGQYPPDQAQRQLWMIASSSVELRKQVDAEINTKFASLLFEFGSKPAELERNYVQETTSEVTAPYPTKSYHHQNKLRQWTEDTVSYGYHGKVAAIIVLDQMSRHVRRYCCDTPNVPTSHNQPSFTTTTTSAAPITCPQTANSSPPQSQSELFHLLPEQAVFDELAYQVSLRFQQEHAAEIACGMIPLPMHVFALMPLRHQATSAEIADSIPTMTKVQEEIEQVMAPLQPQMQALVQRFRKATNRRMAVLQDEARRRGEPPQRRVKTEHLLQSSLLSELHCTAIDANDDKTDLEHHIRADEGEDDILEHVFFKADMSPSQHHPVHKSIVQFLGHRNIQPIDNWTNKGPDVTAADTFATIKLTSTDETNTTDKHQDINTNETETATQTPNHGTSIDPTSRMTSSPNVVPLIISLSGGVDSMVVATVLAHLRDNCNYSHLRLAAVHIDYANRPESAAEADYCARYCQKIGIEFTCRRIGEVTRGITARDEYERRAREIRFQEYRNAVAKARQQVVVEDIQKSAFRSIDSKQKDDIEVVVGVVLGHHRGDLRENVLSNAHKGCGPLDLSGMTEVSKNDGVTLYRPMLILEKTAILDYAHKFGVPYFKDTTPHWSTRGKLRTKLLPLLEEIYGEGSMNNLSALANESDEARSLLYHTVLGPFLNQVSHRPLGIYFDTAEWKSQGLYFWKLVLREALHNAGLGMFKEKSVLSFCERVKAEKLRAGWLQCRRDYAVYLQGDGRVFVLYPKSFPWQKADSFSSFDGQGKRLIMHLESCHYFFSQTSILTSRVLWGRKRHGSRSLACYVADS